MVVHAYSCREENLWAYVSVCGLSWLSVGPGLDHLVAQPLTPPRARLGPASLPTCRLCLRRIQVHTVRARIAADVLRPYDVHDSTVRLVPRLRVA